MSAKKGLYPSLSPPNNGTKTTITIFERNCEMHAEIDKLKLENEKLKQQLLSNAKKESSKNDRKSDEEIVQLKFENEKLKQDKIDLKSINSKYSRDCAATIKANHEKYYGALKKLEKEVKEKLDQIESLSMSHDNPEKTAAFQQYLNELKSIMGVENRLTASAGAPAGEINKNSIERKYVTISDVMVNNEVDYSLLEEKILVAQTLQDISTNSGEEWLADNVKIDLKNASFKLNLDSTLQSATDLDRMLECVYNCNLKTLDLAGLFLSTADLKKLTASKTIEFLRLDGVYISNDKNDGSELKLDKILKEFPNVIEIQIWLNTFYIPTLKAKTAQKLGDLEKFDFLQKFELHNLPSGFKTQHFGKFMNKHSCVQFIFSTDNC